MLKSVKGLEPFHIYVILRDCVTEESRYFTFIKLFGGNFPQLASQGLELECRKKGNKVFGDG